MRKFKWNLKLNLQGKKKLDASKLGQIGVHLGSDGIGFALVKLNKNDKHKLKRLEFTFTNSKQEQATWIRGLEKETSLKDVPINIVLPSSKYQLILIEKPDVDKKEIKQSLKWSLQELVPYDLNEAVIDCFELPKVRGSDSRAMVYTVVSKAQDVEEVIQMFKEANLNLQSVGIPEISLLNVANLLNTGSTPIGLFRMSKGGGRLLYLNNSDLYMLRNIDVSLAGLFNPGGLEEEATIIENLSQEIQRSIEYCANYLKEPPINKLIFTPLLEAHKGSLSNLCQKLNLEFDVLDFNKLMQVEKEYEVQLQANAMLALGGALRPVGIEK